jgi:hypothetical protein
MGAYLHASGTLLAHADAHLKRQSNDVSQLAEWIVVRSEPPQIVAPIILGTFAPTGRGEH